MENLETQGPARGPHSVGSQLRRAREAIGKSRADIASQTKIAERHLIAIEEDRLGEMAGRTYAVGFARTYARAVGLDEQVIAAKAREQLESEVPERPEVPPSFEPGDPARVPTRRLAWIAAIGVIVAVGLLLAFWSSFLSPEGRLPDLVAAQTEKAPEAAPAPSAPPQLAPAPASGPVVLTATGDKVWVKVTDGQGNQVLQKELAMGETWTAPGNIAGLQLRTGRPDALQLSVGDKVLPPLATEPRLVSGISLAAADLLARVDPAAPAVPPANPAAAPLTTAPAPSATPASRAAAPAPRPAASRRPVPRAPASDQPSRGPTPVPTPESLLPPSLSTDNE